MDWKIQKILEFLYLKRVDKALTWRHGTRLVIHTFSDSEFLEEDTASNSVPSIAMDYDSDININEALLDKEFDPVFQWPPPLPLPHLDFRLRTHPNIRNLSKFPSHGHPTIDEWLFIYLYIYSLLYMDFIAKYMATITIYLITNTTVVTAAPLPFLNSFYHLSPAEENTNSYERFSRHLEKYKTAMEKTRLGLNGNCC